MTCIVRFLPFGREVGVAEGTLLSDAAQQAGVALNMPCGGQGRCGRCAVVVESGSVQRRSTQRLTPEDVAAGYALACQTAVESDLVVFVPPQDRIERRLKESKRAAKIELPFQYDPHEKSLRKIAINLAPPNIQDHTGD